ncbi:hypothetical protein [Paraflavitalea speifideaquila]|uniref:hypothetical protein n=1 Tax=Paraflavitalea speifideaquila TaxID=3076558 RepID=UPI0028EF9A4C|nr:hypothetical protein [Paraflavitalea speifideiaquila]
MKKKIFFGVATIAIGAITFIACKRSFNDKFEDRGTTATTTPNCTSCVSTGTDTLRGVLNGNRTLTCNTTYILDGKYYVNNGAQLTIDAGTTIKAIKKGTPAESSAIVVTRGGKIIANGTQTCPVAFTSNEANPAPGDWGGIVLLGKATTNKNAANPTIEGIDLPSVPVGVDVHYGGTDDTDNSGSLVYVRIEYAGQAIATDNELNGLTCGGVGNGTTLDFIQVFKGNDDAFEFFGGTVNAKHLYAYEPDDDAFDFDFGFAGRIQFAVSVLKDTAIYSANPNGIESDNDATGSVDSPRTKAIISNMTVIGFGGNSGNTDSTIARQRGLLNGALFRRNSSFEVRNSIFMGFPTGVNLQSAGTQADKANFRFNLVHGFVDTALTAGGWSTTNAFYRSLSTNGSIKLKNPWVHPNPDFRPDTGSPALASADFTTSPLLPTGNNFTFTTVTYRGAFAGSGVGANWIAGWTK